MADLCIIPARGGSKRIPRKNIKNFLGKPIISYSIEAALKSNLFDEVMVSTDDDEIAIISKSFGAKVPFMRSYENANDFATTVDVLIEVINQYEEKGIIYENICCIYPTAPFVSDTILLKAKNLLESQDYDAVFPVLQYSFPIQRAMRINPNGEIKMIRPEYMAKRSQDLEATFHDAGQFYFLKVLELKRHNKLWTDNTSCIVIDELKAQDIDTETDWKLAELKYQLMQDDEKENSI
ncbi:pseudaminic acid cytidylyltransferase [Abyssalbus ytuae]|uniref:Pseudaminic acid cytidylyltransferase n=1 Tax=Abyssalbus ytuae TaxID=2926907 RepID=A0A9E6ZR67_9FLAO|nr:pseudaminic acid cytidylyltransferase [Abyssalbus ytuae]UOB19414.1 pseudaminic acid cytidylyltransferase [Abyssalbus ytuae]